MNKYESFKFLNDLYFVRTSGSEEERRASELIKEELKKIGLKGKTEKFKVNGYEIKECELAFDGKPFNDCVGTGFSGSTPNEGIRGELIYVDSLEDLEVKDVKDKIVLVTGKLIPSKFYSGLVKKKAIGVIQTAGDIYDDKENTDLDPYMIRPNAYKDGKIPTVCIKIQDAEKLVRDMPKEAYIKLIQDEKEVESQNVIAEIKGTEKEDEIIVFSAHYDSVPFSKGAYDNATGSTAIMQIAEYFNRNKPKRTLRFVWCGSEEIGLMGSKAYVEKHKNDLDNILFNINIDMVGVTLGNDIACATSEMDLVHYLKYFSLIKGFGLKVWQGVYSSDSTPFADKGVPSVSFCRNATRGGAVIHSKKDVLDFLSEKNYYHTVDFIIKFSESLINSVAFPVDKKIPDEMVKEIEKYNNR